MSRAWAIFGYLRFHVLSLEDAEDLLLEVFLAALEHDSLSGLSPGEQLAWLRRVLLNKREGAVRKLLSRTILFLRQTYQQIEGESTC